MQSIKEMKNLPNKVDMTMVPKGPADLALESMSIEEKQGYANRHKFTESDNYYLEKLQKTNDEKVDQLWVIPKFRSFLRIWTFDLIRFLTLTRMCIRRCL